MRIILKPLGVAVLGVAVATLAFLAMRGQKSKDANVLNPSPTITASLPTTSVKDNAGMVYADALENGWSNYSWAKNDLGDTSQSPSNKCIRVDSNKYEAVAFHHEPLDLSAFDRLTFRIYGGEKGGQRLKAVAQYKKAKKEEVGSEVLLPALEPKTWKTVTLSLKELGVDARPDVVGFWFQEAYGEKLAPYYVDDVRFLRPNEAIPGT